jgi:hypothetical protein
MARTCEPGRGKTGLLWSVSTKPVILAIQKQGQVCDDDGRRTGEIARTVRTELCSEGLAAFTRSFRKPLLVETPRRPKRHHFRVADGWWGLGAGMKAYHTFLLVKTDQGCHIITEEVVRGEGAAERNARRPRSLAKGHQRAL